MSHLIKSIGIWQSPLRKKALKISASLKESNLFLGGFHRRIQNFAIRRAHGRGGGEGAIRTSTADFPFTGNYMTDVSLAHLSLLCLQRLSAFGRAENASCITQQYVQTTTFSYFSCYSALISRSGKRVGAGHILLQTVLPY